ncbi:MAG: hypothetical protein H7A40_05210 [Chlamydiales bacterium]|nr:hypothetical protein [Chlamydiales bacterium]
MKALIAIALILSGCGYRLATPGVAADYPQVSVPYVEGDISGVLTAALVRELNARGRFATTDKARYTLHAKIIQNENEQIGWRFDRQGTNAKRISRLRPVESKRIMTVQVSIEDNTSGKLVFGPSKVSADVDYDYVNFDTISDLAFTPPGGGPLVSVLSYSLGQLDAVEDAQTVSLAPLYQKLSKLIAEGLDACEL